MQMLKLVIFTILLFSPLVSSEFEKSNPLYNFQGQCEASDTQCLPFSNISFKNIWDGLTQSIIITKVNAFIKANTPFMFKKKLFIFESRETPGTLGLFADSDIDFNDTIALFKDEQVFSNNYNYQSFKNPEDSSFIQFPELPFNKVNQNFLIMSLNVLYHFYNFEQSPLKDELISYPSQPDIPAFTMSEYEINLLKNDEAYLIVKSLRETINNDYDILMAAIKKHWTEDHITKFTNGKNTISKDDFVYAISLLLSRSFTDRSYKGGENNNNLFVSLAPVMHLAKLFKDKVNSKQIPYAYYTQNTSQVKYISNDFYDKKDEIHQDYNDIGNQYLLMYQKLLVPNNPYDCIPLQFMEKEIADQVGLSQSACVTEKSYEINQYYLTGNLMNMNEEEHKDCTTKMASVQGDTAKQIKLMFEKCAHPAWDKYDVFDTARAQIQTKFYQYDQALKKTEEYLYLRQKDRLSKENGLLIKYYLQEKIEVAKGVIKRLDKLDEISGNLKKLNTKLKDKLKKEGVWGKDRRKDIDQEYTDKDEADDMYFDNYMDMMRKDSINKKKKTEKKRETQTNVKTEL